MLAVRANGAADVLLRIATLVARRGASLRSALVLGDPPGERCGIAIVVAGPARVVSRLPLWIAGLADVFDVQDLLVPAPPSSDALGGEGGGRESITDQAKAGSV